LLSEPDPSEIALDGTLETIHRRCRQPTDHQGNQAHLGELARTRHTVKPDTHTREVYRYLDEHPDDRSVVIVREDKPVGLLMRRHLHEKLSTNTGQSLYWERPVTKITGRDPLILPADTPAGRASQFVTDRSDENLYDEIIVVDPETKQYRGNVSVKQLLEKITQQKTRKARRANPLTGLPGNIGIRDEIRRQLNQDDAFALIYVDLDHFKPFNDYYGFERGDQAILLLKNTLNDGLKVYPDPRNFLGHVGGDDFVVTTAPDRAANFCEYVIDQFDDRIRELYDKQDLEAGGIKTTNRNDTTETFDVMTVSLAVVSNEDRRFDSHLEMSEVAAEVKKYAKRNRNKSSYETDRRRN
jgi:diguanylate cyclase (GGDEF)-like protein